MIENKFGAAPSAVGLIERGQALEKPVLAAAAPSLDSQPLRSGATFGMLFTDIVMPGRVTGQDLVDWCKTHAPDVAAIVATGYTGQQPRRDVIELRKPCRLDELLARLQRASEPIAKP